MFELLPTESCFPVTFPLALLVGLLTLELVFTFLDSSLLGDGQVMDLDVEVDLDSRDTGTESLFVRLMGGSDQGEETVTIAEQVAGANGLPRDHGRDAENAPSAELIGRKADLLRLEAMPKVLAEAVKSAEKIDSFRTHRVSGMSNRVNAAGGSKDKDPINQMLDSIRLAFKKQAEELGLSMGVSLSGLVQEESDEDTSKLKSIEEAYSGT